MTFYKPKVSKDEVEIESLSDFFEAANELIKVLKENSLAKGRGEVNPHSQNAETKAIENFDKQLKCLH